MFKVYVTRILSCCSVRRAASRFGLKEALEGEEWTVYWTDLNVSLDRVMDMRGYQVPRHIYLSVQITAIEINSIHKHVNDISTERVRNLMELGLLCVVG